MKNLFRIIPLLGAMLAPASAEPDAPLRKWTDQPLKIPAFQQDILSKSNGRTYRIFVHVPSSPAPPEGFPVIYLLDGNATYPVATAIQETMLERANAFGVTPGIIVGIGYPTDGKLAPAFRTEDYTPPAPDLTSTGDTSGHPQGGANRFLDFIEGQLKPQIKADFKVNASRQTLFGHSYGGLCTLHTLFTRPNSFQQYFAASPSIWWNGRHILTEKTKFLEDPDTAGFGGRLRMTVGSLEQKASPQQNENNRDQLMSSRRQVDNSRELAADLRAASIDANCLLLAEENHGSARASAINHALRFAFASSEKSLPKR